MATSLEAHGLVLDAAEAQLLRCRSLRGGGRYWDIELKLHEYLSSVNWTWTYGSGKEGEVLGRLMPFGLCAPVSCSVQALQSEVVPRFVGHMLGLNTTTIGLGAPSDAVLNTRELVLWQELPLDFVDDRGHRPLWHQFPAPQSGAAPRDRLPEALRGGLFASISPESSEPAGAGGLPHAAS
mmetsp:Transcript_27804/g.57372  ORF Transcript_27804/g.57372 Transcript_27804/m.57372 type:complete len:181 (-) Transcript_27804:337-879(-)